MFDSDLYYRTGFVFQHLEFSDTENSSHNVLGACRTVR